MEVVILEALHVLARWLHVVAGITWIGTSFYFIALDLGLRQRPGLPNGVQGEAWQVHGGGFYNMVKYLVAPERMPDELTWFKWEAYTTWLSGMALMIVVYYMGAEFYLIDRDVMALEPWQAIGISLGGLVLTWLIYEGLCRSPLGRNDLLLAVVLFVWLVALTWGFGQLLSGRAAFNQIGALIGTIMVANVFVLIIPNQRKTVAALRAGDKPDPIWGKQAKTRSVHNNYLTLPVVFLMVSNHFPLLVTSSWGWLMVAIVLALGLVIRHFFNREHAGKGRPWWTWAVAAAGMFAVFWLSTLDSEEMLSSLPPAPEFEVVEEIVLTRCVACHGDYVGWEGMLVAPKGVKLDTPERIRQHAGLIERFAVRATAMPPGNITEMTGDERRLLAAWLAAR
jgi:uncharacterized membrane protein